MWTPVEGGITAPVGFRAASAAAGIRYQGRDDVALIAADGPCAAAAVFTSNRAQAAPVLVSREHVAGGIARAVVVNAGCANCATGAAGLADARAMASAAAAALGCPPQQVLVASTGVIGPRLPMDRVLPAIAAAAGRLSRDGAAAARAIMTTDTRPKEAAATNGRYTIGGMAKGVGMIHPNMATMLAFVASDAPVAAADLRPVVKRVADRTFNMVTVDGDESTNDTFAVLCGGSAGPVDLDDFEAGLTLVCTELAKKMAADGEGATRLLEVVVEGAASEADARKAARSVVGSSLVKTAVFGQDANWGRILCALGYSGADFRVEDVELRVGDVPVATHGVEMPFDEAEVSRLLGGDVVRFLIRIGPGPGRATAWGCDLSYDYVKINGSYRT
jgi:glutamate N-acetyltransferase/amino-acid N-acetyltransferase